MRVALAALALVVAVVPAASQSPQSMCDQLFRVGAPVEEIAKSGCCSWHGGVCGCRGGRAICCDGAASPSCGC